MGGHADVPDHALFLQRFYVFQNPGGNHFLQIRDFINAVDKTKINIIGFQILQLPVDGTLNLLQVQGPAIGSGVIIRAEMNLKIYLIPATWASFSPA